MIAMRYVEFIGKREDHMIRLESDQDEQDLKSAEQYLRDCGVSFSLQPVPSDRLITGPVIRPDELSDLVAPRDD